jgi:putative oxidoreductase
MMKKLIKAALWIVLGAMFVMAGGAKLMGQHSQVEHFAQWGYPLWFLYLIGIIEVGGGICLFIPKAQFYGIVVLSITMVGAALTHLRAGEMGAFPVPVVLLCLLVMLAWTMRHPVRKN